MRLPHLEISGVCIVGILCLPHICSPASITVITAHIASGRATWTYTPLEIGCLHAEGR